VPPFLLQHSLQMCSPPSSCWTSARVAATLPLPLLRMNLAPVFSGSDLSADAIELARKNAQHLGLEARVSSGRATCSSAFESAEFLGKVDLITCNPPYISSAKVGTMPPRSQTMNPAWHLTAVALGVAILGKLFREAPRFLKPGAFLCFETGLGQGNPMTRLMGNAKEYNNIQTYPDASGNVRALTAQKIRS